MTVMLYIEWKLQRFLVPITPSNYPPNQSDKLSASARQKQKACDLKQHT